MSGPNTATWKLVTLYFARYQSEIIRLLRRRRSDITHAQNSTTLNNRTVADMHVEANSILAAHEADMNNPHQETIETVGSMSANAINAVADSKIPNGIIPVSTYGVGNDMTDADVNNAWTYSGWNLTCNAVMDTIVSGTPYQMPVTTIDLTTVTASPANKTFYVYLHVKFGVAAYRVYTAPIAESAAAMYIGKVTTNASAINSKSFSTVIRVDTFRLSATPLGSVIPVTGGSYDNLVPLPDTWKPL